MTDDCSPIAAPTRAAVAGTSLLVGLLLAAAAASGGRDQPRSTGGVAHDACALRHGLAEHAAREARRWQALSRLYGSKPAQPGELLRWAFDADVLGSPGIADARGRPAAARERIEEFETATGMRLFIGGDPSIRVDLDSTATCEELARQLKRAWGTGWEWSTSSTTWTGADGRHANLSGCRLWFEDTPRSLDWYDTETAAVRRFDAVGKPVDALFAMLGPESSYSWSQVSEQGTFAAEREGEAHVIAHLERSARSQYVVESLEVRGRIDARTWIALRDQISRRWRRRPQQLRVTHDWAGTTSGWICEGSRFTWPGELEVRVDFPCDTPDTELADYTIGVVARGAAQHPRDHEVCDPSAGGRQVCRPKR